MKRSVQTKRAPIAGWPGVRPLVEDIAPMIMRDFQVKSFSVRRLKRVSRLKSATIKLHGGTVVKITNPPEYWKARR